MEKINFNFEKKNLKKLTLIELNLHLSDVLKRNRRKSSDAH